MKIHVQRLGQSLLLAGLIACWGEVLMEQALAKRPFLVRTPRGMDTVRRTHTPSNTILEETEGSQSKFTYLENPDRDVWVFDTRSVSPTNPDERQFQQIKIRRFLQTHQKEKSHWNDSTLDEFWETFEEEVPLIVLVHGNYTSTTEAIESANMLENRLFPGAGPFATAKYRLLIWAWPADTVYKRHLPDAKLKGYYSIKQGEYLAQLLALAPEGSRISLVGFSFGARTTCEAVQRLSEHAAASLQIRNLLLSPAIDQFSLAPRSRYGNVLAVSQQSIVLFNPRDFALWFYPSLTGCGGPKSLGREGLPGLPVELRNKITGINIRKIADKQHSFVVFFRDPNLNRKLGEYLLFE